MNLINDNYSIILLFQKELDSNNNLNQLGMNLNTTNPTKNLDSVSIQTDSIIGLQYVSTNYIRIQPNLIRTT